MNKCLHIFFKQTAEKSYQLFFRSTIELGYFCFQAKKKIVNIDIFFLMDDTLCMYFSSGKLKDKLRRQSPFTYVSASYLGCYGCSVWLKSF